MRQRRLPILVVIFIGILGLVVFRLYCKGTDQRENQDKRDQQEAPSKSNTVSVDKPDPKKSSGNSPDAGSRKETNGSGEATTDPGQETRAGDEPIFNRNLIKIVYSKHARCRMDCRRIDESEILEIREEGKVNYAKSELDSKRDPKFALEGITHDKQHVRIVFAQTPNSHVVVTCIDLDTDWACSCN
ncbi:DUF4258 domain-containing protein [Flavitalea sp.]|nr:DUF4258 domain-containing protein [Flavitalea sp.]